MMFRAQVATTRADLLEQVSDFCVIGGRDNVEDTTEDGFDGNGVSNIIVTEHLPNQTFTPGVYCIYSLFWPQLVCVDMSQN